MPSLTYLVRTMSDTVETDIHRVHVIANGILTRYSKPPLSFDELRKIADGPFDLFLIPLIFEKDYQKDPRVIFNEKRRQEIRDHALEIAHNHSFDVDPPDLIPGIQQSLRETQEAGFINILMTTGGRRFKHQAMERQGLGGFFKEIIDREQTYFTKEQGIYHLFRKKQLQELRVIILSGTATYIKAGNNLERLALVGSCLEVHTVALATDYSYNDEETLQAAKPKLLVHSLEELMPKFRGHGWLAESDAKDLNLPGNITA